MKNNFFGKANIVLIILSVVSLIVGYVFLANPPVDGFLSLTVSPLLLVFVYVILVPVAILWGKNSKA